MNEGAVATRAGIKAQPAAAESSMWRATSSWSRCNGARYHVAHVSSADRMRLVREAKRRGLPVTCEVTPHHLSLTDDACAHYDTAAKYNPPLRGAGDVEALREGCATAPSTPSPPITRRHRRREDVIRAGGVSA